MKPELNADLAMRTLVENYPGARRALFSEFHIGGCQSCAYDPDDSLEKVCQDHDISLEAALQCLRESHGHDQEMLVSPADLAAILRDAETESDATLVDTRTREEFEAITLPGARLMTQELQTALFGDPDQDRRIILIDHQGRSVLDHCAWFRGHGLKNTFGVEGGIDRYAREIDPTIPRYRLEMD